MIRPVFYYGHTVTEESNTLRIDEGSGDVDITLTNGLFSLSEYVQMVTDKLNSNLANTYTITLDRDTRIITINSSGTFALKVLDIFPLNSAFPILGFNVLSNLSGETSYVSDSPCGFAYYPQFPLEKYVPFGNKKEYIDATVKETPSGEIEVISFGVKNRMTCNIKYITDYEMISGAPIETNLNGVSDARKFLDYCIAKGKMEFIPDRNDRDTFNKVLLEKTQDSSNGVGYTLRELEVYGYFETGELTFRELT